VPIFDVSIQTGKNIREAFCELIRMMASSDPEVRQYDCSGEECQL